MQHKVRLYLDFDDTIVDSLECVTEILNQRYDTNVKAEDIERWDGSDQFPMLKNNEMEEVFCEQEFFNNIKLKDGVKEMFEELSLYFDIYIISKGSPTNLRRKQEWIQKNINIPIKFIGLGLNDSKGDVDMNTRSIHIDDHVGYLGESNACIKILFESYKDKEWNRGWEGIRFTRWCAYTTKILKELYLQLM